MDGQNYDPQDHVSIAASRGKNLNRQILILIFYNSWPISLQKSGRAMHEFCRIFPTHTENKAVMQSRLLHLGNIYFQLFPNNTAMTTFPDQLQDCRATPPLRRWTANDAQLWMTAVMEDSASQSCPTNFSAVITFHNKLWNKTAHSLHTGWHKKWNISFLAECCNCIAKFCFCHRMSVTPVYCDKTTANRITQFWLLSS